MVEVKLVKTILVRVGKATASGLLAYVTSYLIPKYLLSRAFETVEQMFPVASMPTPLRLLEYFATIVIFYTVAIELTKGTVLEHFFSVGRGLTMLFFFIYASGGGIMELSIPLSQFGVPGGGSVGFTLDVSRVLMVLIGIDVLDIGKSVLNAVAFLSEKAEKEIEWVS